MTRWDPDNPSVNDRMDWALKQEPGLIEGLMRGESNKEIARNLGMGLRTVQDHMMRLCNVLEIDRKRYIPEVRILYLVAKHRGLI
jgi:DNA-binding NarL/FixJ family response regulator